jgi:hypothetical protein
MVVIYIYPCSCLYISCKHFHLHKRLWNISLHSGAPLTVHVLIECPVYGDSCRAFDIRDPLQGVPWGGNSNVSAGLACPSVTRIIKSIHYDCFTSLITDIYIYMYVCKEHTYVCTCANTTSFDQLCLLFYV